jgi:acetyl-CoA/propionyl-CoA carboxylase biotin carboxyl carrier protein
VRHPDVRAGNLDTALVERDLADLVAPPANELALAGFALARLLPLSPAAGPWDRTDGWRLSGTATTTWRLTAGSSEVITVAVTGDRHQAEVRIGDGSALSCRAEPLPEGFLLTAGDRTVPVLVVSDAGRTWVHVDGATHEFAEAPPVRAAADAADHDGEIVSPMPGSVVAVGTTSGSSVREGEVLVVVEAMKMEHALTAPFDGAVGEVEVRVGDRVSVGQPLVTVRRST